VDLNIEFALQAITDLAREHALCFPLAERSSDLPASSAGILLECGTDGLALLGAAVELPAVLA